MIHLRGALAAFRAIHARAFARVPRVALPVLWALVAALGIVGGAFADDPAKGVAAAVVGLWCAWQGWREWTGRNL